MKTSKWWNTKEMGRPTHLQLSQGFYWTPPGQIGVRLWTPKSLLHHLIPLTSTSLSPSGSRTQSSPRSTHPITPIPFPLGPLLAHCLLLFMEGGCLPGLRVSVLGPSSFKVSFPLRSFQTLHVYVLSFDLTSCLGVFPFSYLHQVIRSALETLPWKINSFPRDFPA